MYGRGNHSNSHSPDDPGGRVNVAADMLEIDAPSAHSTPTSPAHKVQFIQTTKDNMVDETKSAIRAVTLFTQSQ